MPLDLDGKPWAKATAPSHGALGAWESVELWGWVKQWVGVNYGELWWTMVNWWTSQVCMDLHQEILLHDSWSVPDPSAARNIRSWGQAMPGLSVFSCNADGRLDCKVVEVPSWWMTDKTVTPKAAETAFQPLISGHHPAWMLGWSRQLNCCAMAMAAMAHVFSTRVHLLGRRGTSQGGSHQRGRGRIYGDRYGNPPGLLWESAIEFFDLK